jgi:nitrite reductase/ring-hydroxylating ferredoxin subunit
MLVGSIPISKPTPPRAWRLSRRIVPLAMLGAITVAAMVVAAAVAWPSDVTVPQSPVATLANVNDLNVNEPVKVFDYRLYLVKLESGEILALSQKDPHLGCTVPFGPEYTFEGKTGWFRNPCHGETYDLRGVCYDGPCRRGLDRYETVIVGGKVQVNTANLIEGPPVAARGEPVNPASVEEE